MLKNNPHLRKLEGSLPRSGIMLPFHSVSYLVWGVVYKIWLNGFCLDLFLFSEPSRGGTAGDRLTSSANFSLEDLRLLLPAGLGGSLGG